MKGRERIWLPSKKTMTGRWIDEFLSNMDETWDSEEDQDNPLEAI